MINKLKKNFAKLWQADCGIHLLFGILLLLAFLYSLHTPFALADNYGQAYAAEHNIVSPAYRVDWWTSTIGDQNWYIYYNHLRRKVFTLTFDYNEIKAAIPYSQDKREVPFVVLPDDLIDVEILPRAPITKETRAFFILSQPPHWRETLVFHSNVVTDGNSAHIFNISTCRMEKATLTWRNWSDSTVLPATRVILRVWRQTADRGQIGDSFNLHREKELAKNHDWP